MKKNVPFDPSNIIQMSTHFRALNDRTETGFATGMRRQLAHSLALLGLQQISRKISEERRMLHKNTPTDATTSRGRKAAEARNTRRVQQRLSEAEDGRS